MERERYGRGGGGGGGGGINRYPDVSGRPRSSTPTRDDRNYSRGDRPVTSAPPPPRSSSEPWSDVPPELEAMLRAQVAQKPAPSRPSAGSSNPAAEDLAAPVVIDEEPIAKPRATRKPRTTATMAAVETSAGDEAAPAKPRATRKPAASRTSAASKAAAATAVDGDVTDEAPAPTAAAKPRATRKPKAAADAETSADTAATDAPPKRRAPRKTAATDPA